jgi:hypothetical protein
MSGHADQDSRLPALPTAPLRHSFVCERADFPERADFLQDGTPAADRQGRRLLGPRPGVSQRRIGRGGALVSWICDALVSNYTIKADDQGFPDSDRHCPKSQDSHLTPLTSSHDGLGFRFGLGLCLGKSGAHLLLEQTPEVVAGPFQAQMLMRGNGLSTSLQETPDSFRTAASDRAFSASAFDAAAEIARVIERPFDTPYHPSQVSRAVKRVDDWLQSIRANPLARRT